jgi:hypothetical protein
LEHSKLYSMGHDGRRTGSGAEDLSIILLIIHALEAHLKNATKAAPGDGYRRGERGQLMMSCHPCGLWLCVRQLHPRTAPHPGEQTASSGHPPRCPSPDPLSALTRASGSLEQETRTTGISGPSTPCFIVASCAVRYGMQSCLLGHRGAEQSNATSLPSFVAP